MPRTITCGQHGDRRAAFMCAHLIDGTGRGFNWADEDHDVSWWPDAWCDACEPIIAAAGEAWSEETKKRVNVRLVCEVCYEHIRERNWPAHTAASFAALRGDAVAYLLGCQARLEREF